MNAREEVFFAILRNVGMTLLKEVARVRRSDEPVEGQPCESRERQQSHPVATDMDDTKSDRTCYQGSSALETHPTRCIAGRNRFYQNYSLSLVTAPKPKMSCTLYQVHLHQLVSGPGYQAMIVIEAVIGQKGPV